MLLIFGQFALVRVMLTVPVNVKLDLVANPTEVSSFMDAINGPSSVLTDLLLRELVGSELEAKTEILKFFFPFPTASIPTLGSLFLTIISKVCGSVYPLMNCDCLVKVAFVKISSVSVSQQDL